MKPKLALCVLFSHLLAAPAFAAISQWQDMGGGRARLVALADPQTSRVSAVVEIELKEGWKTYWREPGGSGIPPQFSFSGSKHFIAGEILLPAPRLLSAGGSQFAGYMGETGFYFEGQALQPDGAIRVDLLAGVCEEICIPAQVTLELPFSELNVSDPKAQDLIALARSRLPDVPRPGFKIDRVSASAETELTVEAEVPEGPEPALFVEGPAGFQFAPAELIFADAGNLRFRVEVTGLPQGAGLSGTRLRFTLSNGKTAIEQWMAPAH